MTTQRHDLDETRRLLYMALLVPRTHQYELGGTILNALLHHQGTGDDPQVAANALVALFEHGDPTAQGWLRSHITRITSALEGHSPAPLPALTVKVARQGNQEKPPGHYHTITGPWYLSYQKPRPASQAAKPLDARGPGEP